MQARTSAITWVWEAAFYMAAARAWVAAVGTWHECESIVPRFMG